MKKKYKILNITHSGRKGLRRKPVDDWKYDGLIGSVVQLDNYMNQLEQIELFDTIVFRILSGNSGYDKWYTSNVIQISRNLDGMYEIETIDTIYELEEIC